MSQTATVQTPTISHLDPDGWYKPREVADVIRSGPRPVYRAIREGALQAVEINDRGDLRVRGSWGIAWLEQRSTHRP